MTPHDLAPGMRKHLAADLERDLDLDLRVGMEIEGYRWVEWNHAALGEAPLDEAGRFVGHPGDLLAHLYMDARPGTPLGGRPYGHLPRYSMEAGPALRAAERAGLFRLPGLVVTCTDRGVWEIARAEAGIRLKDACLPRLLSRAALLVADTSHPREAV